MTAETDFSSSLEAERADQLCELKVGYFKRYLGKKGEQKKKIIASSKCKKELNYIPLKNTRIFQEKQIKVVIIFIIQRKY